MNFRSHYEDKIEDILENKQKYTLRLMKLHAWDQVAPGAAEQHAQAEAGNTKHRAGRLKCQRSAFRATVSSVVTEI